MENVPSENPKTSRIVPLSIAKALRNLSEPVVIGV
jgi:predicted dinucleotide-utilizing enzyme